MASPSERLAELRAALLELEACAKTEVARRSTLSETHEPYARGARVEIKETPPRPVAARPVVAPVLRRPVLAVVEWWRRWRSRAGAAGTAS